MRYLAILACIGLCVILGYCALIIIMEYNSNHIHRSRDIIISLITFFGVVYMISELWLPWATSIFTR